jgi:hypothetical protein
MELVAFTPTGPLPRSPASGVSDGIGFRAVKVKTGRWLRGEPMARDETERYRKAAEATLQQLDWCIDYLQRIGKRKIAIQLAKNRSSIERKLRAAATA